MLQVIWAISWQNFLLLLGWCFTALRYFPGHFGYGELIYPHCFWASLLGSLLVLSAHSFAINWQLPFLNQQKGENGRRNFFMTKLHEESCRTWGSNQRPSAYQVDVHPIELLRPAKKKHTLFVPYVNSKCADHPVQLHSLIGTFVVHCLDNT